MSPRRFADHAQLRSVCLRLAFLVPALWPIECCADIAPSPGQYSIEKLFATSDAVCLATANAPRQQPGEYEPQRQARRVIRLFDIAEPRCYKGTAEVGEIVTYDSHEPALQPSAPEIRQGERILAFLKRLDGHTLSIADPTYGLLRDASIPTLAVGVGSGMRQLEMDVAASLRGGELNTEEIAGDLRLLHGFDRLAGSTLDQLRGYLSAPGQETLITIGAFSVLAKTGNNGDLQRLCSYLAAHRAGVAEAVAQFSFTSLERPADGSARTGLECLAGAWARPVRLSAMAGLRALASRLSIPELVRHLDDTDPFTQYLAVITLWEIVRPAEEPGPTMPLFEREPGKFTTFWHRWWTENAANIQK